MLKHTRLGNVENIIFEVFERAGVSFSLVESVRRDDDDDIFAIQIIGKYIWK